MIYIFWRLKHVFDQACSPTNHTAGRNLTSHKFFGQGSKCPNITFYFERNHSCNPKTPRINEIQTNIRILEFSTKFPKARSPWFESH